MFPLSSLSSVPLLKYPRTAHLEGSRLQAGDTDDGQTPLSALQGQHVVIEEKLDGANAAVSFTSGGELLLQSRGHYLAGGASERQFNLFKHWAAAHEPTLLERLEDRYVMYGEWCFAKHSCWYDRLPAFFLEFDLYDRQAQCFLSTPARHALLDGSPVLSVPVLYEGEMPHQAKALRSLVRPSLARSPGWKAAFEKAVLQEGQPLDLARQQTDLSDLAEGLYLKTESQGEVTGRYKWVRPDFVQTILDSGSHHSRRPVLPNQLAPGVDLYAPTPQVGWQDLGLRTFRDPAELTTTRRPR
ncbi:RNA ligase family protein [Variovorax paradoxus]|uniref:RNA ligase family protein n=1 Tax=Variovorax paradoxus TaxID=34073 RepID=UPI002480FAB8|nr:RNA ligase family protein [Variovorax paradoxus]WGT62896.1 RNA ligase family protein [Variovorax paradoxus]